MNRLKSSVKGTTAEKKAAEQKQLKQKSVPRKFGDFRFDYISCLKHDLRIDNVRHYSKASLKAAEGTQVFPSFLASRKHQLYHFLLRKETAQW